MKELSQTDKDNLLKLTKTKLVEKLEQTMIHKYNLQVRNDELIELLYQNNIKKRPIINDTSKG